MAAFRTRVYAVKLLLLDHGELVKAMGLDDILIAKGVVDGENLDGEIARQTAILKEYEKTYAHVGAGEQVHVGACVCVHVGAGELLRRRGPVVVLPTRSLLRHCSLCAFCFTATPLRRDLTCPRLLVV